MDIQDLQDKGVGFCFLDSAEKVSVPARYGHGAKGLAPSKGINKLFSSHFGGRQSFGAGAQQAFSTESIFELSCLSCTSMLPLSESVPLKINELQLELFKTARRRKIIAPLAKIQWC